MDYQIILDAWEGSGDIDEPGLVAEQCVGLIARVNDMRGGHHDDQYFRTQWEQSKIFPVRSIYFVYNPWVGGLANWQWLSSRIPKDCPPRIFIDIEVRYMDYSPGAYSREVDTFLDKCTAAGFKPCIYTGAGFLDLLSTWRTDLDYWWARYPLSVMPSKIPHTWADLKAKLANLVFWTADLVTKHLSPGKVKLWQVSGDKWILPGCAGKAMDISIWNGDLESLKTWWGIGSTVPPVVVTVDDHLPAFLQKLDALVAEAKAGYE